MGLVAIGTHGDSVQRLGLLYRLLVRLGMAVQLSRAMRRRILRARLLHCRVRVQATRA